MLLFSVCCFSQQMDSLEIYTPLPDQKKVHTIKEKEMLNWRMLNKQLDSLSEIYKKDKFLVKFYMSDGKIIPSVYSRNPQPKKLINRTII